MPPSQNRPATNPKKEDRSYQHTMDSKDGFDIRSGVTGIIKSFSDMPKYVGSFQDDLDETIEAL